MKASENYKYSEKTNSTLEVEDNCADPALVLVPMILPDWHGTILICENAKKQHGVSFESAVQSVGIWNLDFAKQMFFVSVE